MGMLYDDMMEQMPALEFLERMTLDTMDHTPPAAARPAEQTPEEILAMFPVTVRPDSEPARREPRRKRG